MKLSPRTVIELLKPDSFGCAPSARQSGSCRVSGGIFREEGRENLANRIAGGSNASLLQATSNRVHSKPSPLPGGEVHTVGSPPWELTIREDYYEPSMRIAVRD